MTGRLSQGNDTILFLNNSSFFQDVATAKTNSKGILLKIHVAFVKTSNSSSLSEDIISRSSRKPYHELKK